MSTDATIVFKEWLPDLPPLDNPGMIEALNALPVDGTYKSFSLLDSSGSTAPAAPKFALRVQHAASSQEMVYVGDETSLSVSTAGGAFTELSAATYGATYWDMAVFDGKVYASDLNIPIQRHTIGSAGNFATAGSSPGTAPPARAIGRVGQFLVAGWVGGTRNLVRWPAIDNPESWPAPLSATAIASQAGEQLLEDWGGVHAIRGGDQFGIIWQPGGMHRMTYQGGGVVFRFDVISRTIGCGFPRSIIHVGGKWYFFSGGGFYVTDGVSVTPIGSNKVDRYVRALLEGGRPQDFSAGVDPLRKLIYWAFPYLTGVGLTGFADEIIFYNYEENRFSHAAYVTAGLIHREWVGAAEGNPVFGFNSSVRYGTFSAAPSLSAVLTTAETEPNPGGYSRIKGVKPLVDVTANAVTVAIGTRNNRSDAPTFTSEITANSRSGFCAFRQEGRYHRARTTIAGTFNAAQGIEVDAEFSGQT